ncbi:uncharacterized protein K460DRAFT_400909 [Cucurbitaria berberidis CBS 394.84]|uniref:Uncharacterized protein n=1 Tax=Cucurbitaria berberidis CBS 394.84 TaxID=1168544 RepID=A0A9P4GTP2_9PLEO|nr:uncharacterized protein K460DRAFT_400909 [Cucurbitaria berberidis CBS 394.84]KAF1850871.1 hypothetical protein K460DRAFT_400909 [Cucurbitaria berberidis CBS 394.84]
MTEDRKYETGLTTASEESLPPPAYSRTWGNDSVKSEGKRGSWRSSWTWKPKWTWSLQHGSSSIYRTAQKKVKPMLLNLRDIRVSKKQCIALFLVISCSVVPFILLGYYTPPNDSDPGIMPFMGIFQGKVIGCGDTLHGTPQNAKVSGIENLFVLDKTFGSLTFSQVKMIDVVWDVLLGRGVQILAWWVGYVVFSDALLRAIERHPASFRIFQRIALEGPSWLSVWTLMQEVWVAKSRRTKALFLYMFLSTCYILSVPLLLSAMTGYDSTTIAWVSLGDDNNIVPASRLDQSWIIWGTRNETWERNVCKPTSLMWDLQSFSSDHLRYCSCQLRNGSLVAPIPPNRYYYYPYPMIPDCNYNYPGNMETYKSHDSSLGKDITKNCNATFDVTINDKTYDGTNLNATQGYCYNSVGYDSMALYDKSRCLPDTANPSYQWGFSTMMSAFFIFLQMAWCLTMYAVWQDAQFNSTLVKSGYQMTILRATFAMAKAAKRKTGLGERQLVRANTKEIEQELYGGKQHKGTTVDYGLFIDDIEHGRDDSEVVRRVVRPKDEPD